jgi:hypothetical protein
MGKAGPASPQVQQEWKRRVEAEYRSTAASANLALWLVQIAASPDLVSAALRIAREELGHASGSHRVYRAAGGSAEVDLDRGGLELPRSGAPLEDDVARVCVEVFCLGETVAVRLFGQMRRRCTVPVARRLIERILRDEVGHRDFGWSLLAWLLEHPAHGGRLREQVGRELPGSLDRIRAEYAPELATHAGCGPASLTADDVRWGLLPVARYGEILAEAFTSDYVPRFARLGIDARGAWRTRQGRLAQGAVRE